MMNLTVWQTLAIAMIPAAITAANSWGLKLYEIKQIKNAPKTPPEIRIEARERKRKKRNRFVLFMFCCIAVAICVSSLVWRIKYPSKYQNLDTFSIVTDVALALINLRILIFWKVDRAKWELAHEALGQLDKNERDIKDMQQKVFKISEDLKKRDNKGKSN